MDLIRIGIVGYGNVAKGVEKAVAASPDMELRAVFTRRDPSSLRLIEAATPVFSVSNAVDMTDKIDVMVLCGGSATDLKSQGPHFAALFNIVDSFDTHALIPEYMAAIDAVAIKTTAIISSGWDPGLFSLFRLLSNTVLPDGESYTFWGRGVSQGHSDALRHISGVKNAVQYTVPLDSAIESARSGDRPVFEARQKHKRDCYIVVYPDADKVLIEKEIKNMPYYFADYDTTIYFIDDEEFQIKHSEMPHGGMVLHSGNTGDNKHMMEFSLKLDSNPEFTGSILAAYARAAYRLSRAGVYGVKTVFDVPISYLSAIERSKIIKEFL